MLTTQKANAYSPWTACSVFDFWVNLVKTENCQFKLKFCSQINSNIRNSIVMFTLLGTLGTQTNLNMQNSMVVSILCFRLEIPFLGKFDKKKKNGHFKLEISIQTNLNMENLMVMFIVSHFDQEYPFFENFLKNLNLFVEAEIWNRD